MVAKEPAEVRPFDFSRFEEAVARSFRYHTDLREPMNVAVRSEAEWRGLWSRVWERQPSTPPLPQVDFERAMLLLAAMGQRRTGGYAIRIDDVADTGPEIVATVRRTSPGSKCGTSAAMTAPVDVVRVPRSQKSIRWIVRDETSYCP
jgi:hypothetical protein